MIPVPRGAAIGGETPRCIAPEGASKGPTPRAEPSFDKLWRDVSSLLTEPGRST